MVLENTLESPLRFREIKPINPKVNQPWIFTGRTDAKTEAPLLWPPDAKNWLIGKDPDARTDWGQEEKGTTEDERDGWMVSPTQWSWIWANSGRWWWTGKSGVLQSMGSQRVGQKLETEQQQTCNQWLLGKASHWRLSSHFSRNPMASWSSRAGTEQCFSGWAPDEDADLH